MPSRILSLFVFLAVALGLSACQGSPATPQPPPTAPERPTPLPLGLPPVQAPGWENVPVETVCLEVAQTFPNVEEAGFSLPVAQSTTYILSALGLQVLETGANCDAILAITLTGWAGGATYTREATSVYCYTGASLEGELTLSAPGQETVTLPFDGHVPTPDMLWGSCLQETSAEAPFPWQDPLLDDLVYLWGPRVLVSALGVWEIDNVARQRLEQPDVDAAEVVPALIYAVGDPHYDLQYNAHRALQAISGEYFPARSEAWQAWWDDHQAAGE